MTPDDLAATHAAAFAPGERWEAAAFAALLAQPGSILTGDARAFALIRVVLDEAEVLTIATRPDARRRGLAAAALARGMALAAARGATRIFLEVAADNTAARALYARAGFVPIATRKGYYRRPGAPAVDAVVMARPLPPDSPGPLPAPDPAAT